MHSRLTGISPKDKYRRKASQSHHIHSNQYGTDTNSAPFLLSLPSESLTHITCYLDPVSLLALCGVNKQLYDHLKDDNVWHRAFTCQFLGIEPESDLNDTNSLTLRRSEPSWKREFITKYYLRSRWAYSRNATITHVPHHSTISDIHLLSDDALLSSSLQYGIVARSFPFNGKVVKGFLDTTGSLHGIGVGNPNAEFTPNVTTCALRSEGGSAKIIWGFRNGSISVITHARTMVAPRTPTKIHHSSVEEEHLGAVNDALWTSDGRGCVTGSADGVIKIWSIERLHCLWTSPVSAGDRKPCIKVTEDLANGVVVGALEGGDIVVYSGFHSAFLDGDVSSQPQPLANYLRIPAPISSTSNVSQTDESEESNSEILSLFIDPNTRAPGYVWLLAGHHSNALFYRYQINLLSGHVECTSFGDKDFAPVRCIQPYFAITPDEPSFIVVGDFFGCLSIYDWNATPLATTGSVLNVQRIEAFLDGSVSAIAFDHCILAAGSSAGNIRIFDILTFELLRSFAPPVQEYVRKILLNSDMLVASVGSRIIAWKASARYGPSKPSNKKGKRASTAKWQQQIELRHDIAESREALYEESRHFRKVFGREREQLSTLEKLGLDEREAVDYVLMLSREDENKRRNQILWQNETIGSSSSDQRDSTFSPSGASPSPRLNAPPRSSSRHLASPSASESNDQTSHHIGTGSSRSRETSSSTSYEASSSASVPSDAERDVQHFPSMSSISSTLPVQIPATPGWSLPSGRDNSWSASLRRTASSPSIMSQSSVTNSQTSSTLASQSPLEGDSELEAIEAIEDEELRFALQLSLAEARSRSATS